MRIIYQPVFQQLHDLTDHYYRALWALRPFLDNGWSLIMPVRGEAEAGPGARPAYLDPALEVVDIRYRGQLDLRTSDPGLRDSDLLLVWRRDHPAASLPGAHIVDESGFHPAAERYLRPVKSLQPGHGDTKKLARWICDHQANRTWIFGTGPSIATFSPDLKSGDTVIVCNSMVKNRQFIARVNPDAIVFSDPVFHSGPSRIAARFRADLIDATRSTSSALIMLKQDAILLRTHLPEDLKDRIIGLDTTKKGPILPDFKVASIARDTSNILTLFMLPLAAATANEICLAGFDGKAITPESERYFWNHAANSQYQEGLVDAELAHPAFFQRNYVDYYAAHCRMLAQQCSAAEARGIRIRCMTHSYIPALATRSVGAQIDRAAQKVAQRRSTRNALMGAASTILLMISTYAAGYAFMVGGVMLILAAFIIRREDAGTMSLELIAFVLATFGFGVLAAFAYNQWSSRRLESRLRQELTDQQVRIQRALHQRIENLEAEIRGISRS